MDEHFRTAPLERNLPVLLGLVGVALLMGLVAPGTTMVAQAPRIGLGVNEDFDVGVVTAQRGHHGATALAGVHLVAILHEHALDDAALQWLHQLGPLADDDAALRYGDDVDLAEDGPEEGDDEDEEVFRDVPEDADSNEPEKLRTIKGLGKVPGTFNDPVYFRYLNDFSVTPTECMFVADGAFGELDAAKAELDAFRANPADAKYDGASNQAERIRTDEEKKQERRRGAESPLEPRAEESQGEREHADGTEHEGCVLLHAAGLDEAEEAS